MIRKIKTISFEEREHYDTISFKSSYLIYVNFGTPTRYLGLYFLFCLVVNLRTFWCIFTIG